MSRVHVTAVSRAQGCRAFKLYDSSTFHEGSGTPELDLKFTFERNRFLQAGQRRRQKTARLLIYGGGGQSTEQIMVIGAGPAVLEFDSAKGCDSAGAFLQAAFHALYTLATNGEYTVLQVCSGNTMW